MQQLTQSEPYQSLNHSTILYALLTSWQLSQQHFITRGFWEGSLVLHAPDVAVALPADVPEDHTLCSSEFLHQ